MRRVRTLIVGAALVAGAGSLGVALSGAVHSRTAGGGPPAGSAAAESPAGGTTVEAVRRRGYEAARWHRLHFEPDIGRARDAECLVCHQEVLDRKVLPLSPAGIRADEALAWYQTLDTYEGPQETFHRRHYVTPFAREVMDLSCNFCHRGSDPREQAPSTLLARGVTQAGDGNAPFTLRKTVDPSETCLLCHGSFDWEIMQLPGPWHEVRADLETEQAPNGCLTCHAELFRTVRHQVTYLRAERIEELAKESSDVCYGCHGGRSWYRIAYPYPRHPWPGMDPEVPDWAKDRPTESNPRFRLAR